MFNIYRKKCILNCGFLLKYYKNTTKAVSTNFNHKNQKIKNIKLTKDLPSKSQSKFAHKNQIFQWQNYGKEVTQIFDSNKNVTDVDICFLARKIQSKEITLDSKLAQKLKLKLKQLQTIDFSLLPELLNLSFLLGNYNPSENLIESFLDYYRLNKFTQEQMKTLKFPTFFLKKISFRIFVVVSQKNSDEIVSVFNFFCKLMSPNQLKQIDQFCKINIKYIDLQVIVRLVNIFRQIKKRGVFIDMAQQVILENQKKLSPKYLIMTIINLLQLKKSSNISAFQTAIIQRMSQKQLKITQVSALIQIFHKYKSGSIILWQKFVKSFKSISEIPFQHLYAIMSGFTRNYKVESQLLLKLIEKEPSMSYVQKLQQMQFVQFFLVVYFSYSKLSVQMQQKYVGLLKHVIIDKKMNNISNQIKHFYLYLFQTDEFLKNTYLKKAYPSNIQLALLTLAFTNNNFNSDHRQVEAYRKDLLQRYSQKHLNQNIQIIVIEEFIRYKLMAIKKPEVQ